MVRAIILGAVILASCACDGSAGADPPLVLLDGGTDDAGPVEGAIYVDAVADEGGDGTLAAPFRTLDEALALTTPFDRIIVAPGAYAMAAAHTEARALIIQGAGAAQTTLAGAEPVVWTLEAALRFEALGLASAVDFTGATGQVDLDGVLVAGPAARLTLSNLESAHISQSTVREGVGIAATGVSPLTIDGTQIEGVSEFGLDLTDCGAQLTGLTVAGVTGTEDLRGDGVGVHGGTVTLSESTVFDVGGRGVALDNGAVATFDTVRLEQSVRALLSIQSAAEVGGEALTLVGGAIGVFVSDGQAALSASTVTACPTAGLLAGPGSNITLTGMTFTNNAGGHVSLIGGGITADISDSTLTNAEAGTCLSITGTAEPVRLRDLDVSGCNGVGISVLEATDVEVRGCEVSDVILDPVFEVGEGFNVVDGVATLVDNHVHDTGGRGVGLIRATVIIEGNTIEDTGDAGINVLDPGPRPSRIADNIFRRCNGAGITAFTAPVEIVGNRVEDTRYNVAFRLGDGIAFGAGAAVSLLGNTVTGSARSGVSFFDGATGTIEDNTITGSFAFGVVDYCIGEDTAVTLGDNTLMDNRQGDVSVCE